MADLPAAGAGPLAALGWTGTVDRSPNDPVLRELLARSEGGA